MIMSNEIDTKFNDAQNKLDKLDTNALGLIIAMCCYSILKKNEKEEK